VVKALNTVFASRMIDPDPRDGPTTTRIAGDDSDAKSAVTELLGSIGWEVEDLGGLERARELEHELVAEVAAMAAPR
jgi:hypothetical protein